MLNDYKTILQKALEEYVRLLKCRQEIDLSIAQQEQFVRATMNMLPNNERAQFEKDLDTAALPPSGLSDSIRKVLSGAPRKWHTAAAVRDALLASGFSFGNYASNPLASVHSSLKRLKPEEAETDAVDGVMVWRWNGSAILRRRRFHRKSTNFFAALRHDNTSYAASIPAVANMLNITELPPGEKKK